MVTCSWGHDTAKEILQPPWWPDDVAFSHPFVRPSEVPHDWSTKLKDLVRKCYNYHKSAFLLVFSAQLSRYPQKRLRYVDNQDHTTSLYFVPTGRLLVTFRNENIYYDRTPSVVSQQRSADIYLCDNCDSHFDNIDIFQAHERLCNNDEAPSSTYNGGPEEFFASLKLRPISEDVNKKQTVSRTEGTAKQVRTVASIDRGPPYPFSSLAYTKNIKNNNPRDTTYARDRIERYCLNTSMPTSKILTGKNKNNPFPIRYRRPIDYWHRKHVFPCQRNKKFLDVNGQLMLLKCRPIEVNVQRMSIESMQAYIDNLREESKKKALAQAEIDIEFVEGFKGEHAPETEQLHKDADPLTRMENHCEEVIDLCSDDESPMPNENCDPRVGVTCVMRGGAVLRRTATTPSVLPAEPCGARRRPVPVTVLQSHPVILFAQSLSNLQTIAID